MIVLITGANGGLGRAMARRFLDDGARRVWLGVHTGREYAEGLVKEWPDRCRLLPLDVTSPDDWKAGIEAILDEDGTLGVLVNNAGFHQDRLLAMMSDEDWERVLATNLNGVYYGCRAVVRPMMAARHGRIVNIASLSAILAPAGQTNYAAAKAGVIAFTQSLAKETARSGITVNAVCPGYIETEPLVRLSGAEKESLIRQIPMRRMGRVEEVAAAVAFLSGAEASYITGAVLKIDGGIL